MPTDFTLSHWIALTAGLTLLVIFAAFVWLHRLRPKTKDEFFFTSSRLTKNRTANNLSATATSLAGALLFFLLQTPQYGGVIFLVVGLALVGQWIFLQVIRTVDPTPADTGSVYRLIASRTDHQALALVANAVVVMNFLIILLIELVIGAQIFAYFLPVSQLWAMLAGMVILAIIVAFYVLIGGFELVTYSDTWQFRLVAAGVLAALALTAASFIFDGQKTARVLTVFAQPSTSPLVWGSFLVNAIFVNLMLPTSQISSWQRFTATRDKNEYIAGTKKAIYRQYGWIWFAAIVLSAFLFAWDKPPADLPGLFDTIRKMGLLGDLFVFPLLFVGLMSALISTADSLLISLFLGVEEFWESFQTRRHQNASESDNTFRGLRMRLFVFGVFVVLLAVGLLFLLNTSDRFGGIIVQMMFAGYGQATLLFPVIVYASRRTPTTYSDTHWPVCGIVAGLILLWTLSGLAIYRDSLLLTHSAPIIGLAAVWFAAWKGFSPPRNTVGVGS